MPFQNFCGSWLYSVSLPRPCPFPPTTPHPTPPHPYLSPSAPRVGSSACSPCPAGTYYGATGAHARRDSGRGRSRGRYRDIDESKSERKRGICGRDGRATASVQGDGGSIPTSGALEVWPCDFGLKQFGWLMNQLGGPQF